MLSNKTFLRIISLVAAVLLWAYVVGEVDPETTAKIGDVRISFANEEVLAEEGLAALPNDGMAISAVIKGKRSRVNDVKKTGLSAHVDVSSCKEGSNNRRIVINAPEGISVESESGEWLSFVVEKLDEAEKPLSIDFADGTGEPSETVPWVLEISPESVMVRGPESLVERVTEVKGTVSAGKLSDEDSEKWVYVSAVPVDKRGLKVNGVFIENSDNIQARIGLLKLKTVALELSAVNVGEDLDAEIVDAPDRIQIVGYDRAIDGTDTIEGTVDMSEETAAGTVKIKTNLNLPDGIYLYDGKDGPTVEVRLTKAE